MSMQSSWVRVILSASLLGLVVGCGGGATTADGSLLSKDAVFQAAQSGDLDTLFMALENGTLGVNDVDPDGRTLLHHAAAGNQRDVVYRLIEEYQADPNVRDSAGRTPLSYAREVGNRQIVDMIERSGGTE